ncbi:MULTISPECIES: GNAT family N-acetyltransferase [Bacillus]|uniref:N-acetyltransferase n=1 Tax=Bacillus cereus TaxID=1396 RepID=A0A2C1LQW6_BACCE|nr:MULTISPECIES: GNAT family N-acetyltransferase [Bacillus]PFA58035.1 N-acetyltransferase [Bacillus sp. AFS015896]PGL86844.1 N-acetyltransferase [Bacillus sp. AFS054943]PGU00654.1 N-acetyltransferase [Bacillus cereus]
MLETKRCLLDVVHESDYESIKELYLNVEVRKYLGGPRKEATLRDVVNDMLSPEESCWYWIVRDRKTKTFMGVVSLDPNDVNQDIEVSYQLLPMYWRVGYATEVVQEVLRYAFHELQLPKVIAVTQMANIPSRKLLERLRMKLIQKYYRFGAEQAVYSIEATETILLD